jgi:hypothetical protein
MTYSSLAKEKPYACLPSRFVYFSLSQLLVDVKGIPDDLAEAEFHLLMCLQVT